MELSQKVPDNYVEVGFTWWTVWGWINLVTGSVMVLAMRPDSATMLLAMALNIFLSVMILRMNKYAFLVATILSANPILWVINGVYLKRRWNLAKVNG